MAKLNPKEEEALAKFQTKILHDTTTNLKNLERFKSAARAKPFLYEAPYNFTLAVSSPQNAVAEVVLLKKIECLYHQRPVTEDEFF